jgi:hypothetical protein
MGSHEILFTTPILIGPGLAPQTLKQLTTIETMSCKHSRKLS